MSAASLTQDRRTAHRTSEAPFLEVQNLRNDLDTGRSRFAACEGVSFSIGGGEPYGLVGESGCGKSLPPLTLIGLLRPPLHFGGGTIRFDGQEIQRLSPAAMRDFRGKRIAMI